MQDFDANEDLARLRAAGQGDAPESADRAEAERPLPGAHRPRRGSAQRRDGRPSSPAVSALTRRRRASRSACPRRGSVLFAQPPSRLRRRRWAMCHGRPPGSRR